VSSAAPGRGTAGFKALSLAFAALAAFFCLKTGELLRQVRAGQTVYQLDYQFGPYAYFLSHDGAYEDCTTAPCRRASRMPLLPCLLALCARASDSARAAACAKNLALTLLCGFCVARFMGLHARYFPGSGRWWLLLLPLALAPPLARLACMVNCEEGLLLELLFAWAFLFLYAALAWVRGQRGDAGRLVVGCLLAATLAYLAKDAMLLVWLASLALAGAWALRQGSRRVGAAVLLSAACVAGWGMHNLEATGRLSIGTSFDGENLFRGFNAQSAVVYPDIHLDQILQEVHTVRLDDGSAYLIGGYGSGSYGDEWQWSDHFKGLALDWVRQDPAGALRFQLKKARYFLLGLSVRPHDTLLDPADEAWARAFLVLGRAFELALLGLAAWLWARGGREGRVLAAAAAALNLAYAAPYLAGFGYERHVLVWLVLVAVSVFVLASAASAQGARRAAGGGASNA